MTITAEEFARINGATLTEPVPGRATIETVGVETSREVVINDTKAVEKTNREVVVNDTKAVEKMAKAKKRKSRQAC